MENGDLFARGDLLENLEGEGQLMPSPELTATVVRPAEETVVLARPAVLLPIIGKGRGSGDIARNGKHKGEGARRGRVPIAVKLRKHLTRGRALDIAGKLRDTDIVGDGIHGETSFKNLIL